MTITINGKPCECEKGEFLLQIAKRNGFEIPTLCHHEALPGQGSCRLCIVEVVERGRGKIVVSCVYPVEHACEVYTNSEKVRRQRGMILRLLQKRAPESEEIQRLCEKYGAPEIERFVKADSGKCVLCGLCVKACAELSVGAISTVNRGVTKEVAPPYYEPSVVCIGCGSCARVCPTGAIELRDEGNIRSIWGKKFQLVRCTRCGAVVGTRPELKLAAARAGADTMETLCPDCRKMAMADVFAQNFGE